MATRDYHADDMRKAGHCYRHGGSVCPGCMEEQMLRPAVPDQPTPEPLSPQARAVLEAADAAVLRYEAEFPCGSRKPDWARLCEAVHAYRVRDLQPEGVRPQTLLSGTRFYFVGEPQTGPTGEIVQMDVYGGRRAYLAAGHVVCQFADGDLVCPLHEEQ